MDLTRFIERLRELLPEDWQVTWSEPTGPSDRRADAVLRIRTPDGPEARLGGIPGVGDRVLSHRLSQLSTGSRSRMGDEPWAQGASEFFRLKLDPEVLEKAILSRFKGPPNSSTPKSTV